MQGKALIFSAPSGSGKTTIVSHLLNVNHHLQFSVSATTRKPRGQEVDGKDYFFLSKEEYVKREFVESEEVYEGVFYGTLKSQIDHIWSQGKTVIFDVDVKGGVNLKTYFGENALSVFVKVPDISALKERLQSRNTESEDNLKERIAKAELEMSYQYQFDRILLNKDLKETLKEAEVLVDGFLNQ